MKPVTVGIVVAAAVIVAFVIGSAVDFSDGSIESPLEGDGPLEQVGEALDDATK